MDNHKHWLLEKVHSHDEKLALVYDGCEFSFNQISSQIDIYYPYIQEKINKGDVVAIHSDYNFFSIALFLALLDYGCIVVPITTIIKEEVNDRLEEGYVDFTIHLDGENFINISDTHDNREKHALINNIQNIGNAGLILYSSGSTGKPKAMIHDLDHLCNVYRKKKTKSLSMMVFLMFDHIGGLNTLLSALSMGALMVIPTKREANHVAQLIQDYKVRILPASPTFLNMMLMSDVHNKYDMKSLRMITYGTEPMPATLLGRLKKAFPRTKFLQTFGTSETGIAQTVSKSSESTFMKFEDPNLEHKVIDGELWLRSKTQITGYLNASMESFTDDHWFKTGDLVAQTDDGYIKIIGRAKEIINVGGEKVLPAEVEAILLLADEVVDCTVYGEKNSITGQNVAVKVVLSSNLNRREAKKMVRKICMGKLESYKIPSTVIIVDKTETSTRFKKKRN